MLENWFKVSSDELLPTFNDHVQVNILFIRELGKEPILHARDTAPLYAATVSLPNRYMDVVSVPVVKLWKNNHGAKKIVSADVQFVSTPFKDMLKNSGILFKERPA